MTIPEAVADMAELLKLNAAALVALQRRVESLERLTGLAWNSITSDKVANRKPDDNRPEHQALTQDETTR